MSPLPRSATALAELLLGAYHHNRLIDRIANQAEPASADDAYAVQRELLTRGGHAAGGWKVGAKSAEGPAQGAPLPQKGILPSPATLARADYRPGGIELEIAFSFNRDFPATDAPYSDDEVLGSLAGMRAAVEIVASRFAEWPNVGKLLQLADLQNHGALIVGQMIDYDPDFPFVSPQARVSHAGKPVFNGPGANPAHDPRRLLPWLVNHCTSQGLSLPMGAVVTTGTYTGLYVPDCAGTLTAEIAGLPPIELFLA
jgi:2-keto-4-pentenoate hydratase